MQEAFYVGISAQVALQRRLETIANNVANTGTAGFRAEQVKFESLLSDAGAEAVAFASQGQPKLSLRQAEFIQTGSPLDVAIEGDAWLATQTPDGVAYTRDGRMRMAENGDLQTLDGHAVLDAGGAPITLDPTAGAPAISHDGAINQGGRRTGVIGLFAFGENARLLRGANASVVADTPPEPMLDFSRAGIVQGYFERANVNAVGEMSRLISVSRAFDAVSTAIGSTESALTQALRTLGGAR